MGDSKAKTMITRNRKVTDGACSTTVDQGGRETEYDGKIVRKDQGLVHYSEVGLPYEIALTVGGKVVHKLSGAVDAGGAIQIWSRSVPDAPAPDAPAPDAPAPDASVPERKVTDG